MMKQACSYQKAASTGAGGAGDRQKGLVEHQAEGVVVVVGGGFLDSGGQRTPLEDLNSLPW